MFTQLLPSIYRWAIYAVVGAAILATVAGKAYLAGDDHGQALVRGADAKAQKAVYARFEWNVQNGVKLAGELAGEKSASADKIGKLKQEIIDAKRLTMPAPAGSTAMPELTAHAVSLFNDAWSGIQLPGGSPAARANGRATLAGTDDQSASGFDIRDALYSDNRNADACWAWILELKNLHQYERDRAAHAKH